MKKFNSTNEILDFAIQGEQDAIDFYANLYKKAKHTHIKEAYKEYIAEEQSHKSKLQKLKAEGKLDIIESKIVDLKISDYLTEQEPNDDMNYTEALIVAMQKEKAAFRLYSDLAELTDDVELKKTFTFLANEEAKHKLKFETEYDDNVLKEN